MTNRPGAVYAAEDQVAAVLERGGVIDFHGSTLDVPAQRQFGDLDGVRRYLQALRAQHRGGGETPPPRVRRRRGQTRAQWTAPDEIALPERWAMTELVVLHEYAHHVQWHRTGTTGHDRTFCSLVCDLLTTALSPTAGTLLMAAYDQTGAWR